MAPSKLQAKDLGRHRRRRTLLAKVSAHLVGKSLMTEINTRIDIAFQSNEDYVDYLLLEDQANYMNFFDWMFKTSREKLLQSYDEYWRRLCQYFELFARHRVSEDARKQMRRVSYVLSVPIKSMLILKKFSQVRFQPSAESPDERRTKTL